MGYRAGTGALWGGFFGLICFRSFRWHKFSILYGAGFGLGMCAPAANQLRKEFFHYGGGCGANGFAKNDQEFYRELDLIQKEIELRNKFKH